MNGIASSPASRIVSSRRAGTLSGEAQCGPPRAASRSAVVSSMIPIEAATGRSAFELIPRHHAGVEVRQQPGLLEHAPRASREVLERRRAAEPGELLAGHPVAQLRLVAEREQRLGAARRGAGPGDLEHLLLAHERAFAAPRRPGERAVAADVAAQRRQRDEDLRRVRDERSRAVRAARASATRRRAASGGARRGLAHRRVECRRAVSSRRSRAYANRHAFDGRRSAWPIRIHADELGGRRRGAPGGRLG